ncbi:MAG TPA: HigA family addiction module antitoxin [Spirochaetota bacterium]|nr:HigA family addiction module antitoxin [Spirochaetota bacterium]HNT12965.1 HigA family addiction module antitoxin [Spirochaetota bacterium]
MKHLPNIHPGEVLLEEFLQPLDLTAYRLAKETGIPQTRISEIIKKKRRISADTALRLGRFLGISPEFWLGLQNDYDLEEERKRIVHDLKKIKRRPMTSVDANKKVAVKHRTSRARLVR